MFSHNKNNYTFDYYIGRSKRLFDDYFEKYKLKYGTRKLTKIKKLFRPAIYVETIELNNYDNIENRFFETMCDTITKTVSEKLKELNND